MAEKKKETVAKREPTVSERFVAKVQQEFEGAVGHGVAFTAYEKQLASNLYIHIDSELKRLDADRLKSSGGERKTAITWKTINMQKLATDAVHRIRVGLDALIPNHISIIPYFNSKLQVYDVDLRIGYKGKDYYRRRAAGTKPKDIRYELVHETDEFTPIKKSGQVDVEGYEFKITQPFDRGDVIGGFGYIMYEDPTKNYLAIVSEKEFKKAEGIAKASNFWRDWGDKMRYKTLVHRTTDYLDTDPEKVNSSYHYVEAQDSIFTEPERQRIDIPAETVVSDDQGQQPGPPEQPEAQAEPQNGNGDQPEEKADPNKPSVVLEYRSNIISCKTIAEIEKIRTAVKESLSTGDINKADFKAINQAIDDRVGELGKKK